MPDPKPECDHVIGTHDDDGHETPLVFGELPNGGAIYKFYPYSFCPECGERIKDLVAARIAEIGIELRNP